MSTSHIDRVAPNSVQCPHCFSAGAASVRLANGSTIAFFLCGSNTRDDHRTPTCYEQELSREVLRRTAGLDYLRERMSQLKPQQHKLHGELGSVTNVLCGGKPLQEHRAS